MPNEELYENDLIVNLTIDGTEYQDVEVTVSNPNKTIREQIDSIVRVFELPGKYPNGLTRQYLIGLLSENGQEPEILEFEDEDGNEQSFRDYHIKKGDHLCLIEVPLYGCPMTDDEEDEYSEEYTHKNKKKRKPSWRHILYACWL